MKNTYLLIMAFAFAVGLQAQVVNFDTLIMPLERPSKDLENYLVQVAWVNNPIMKTYDYNKEIARNEMELEKRRWMEEVRASFNINESNIRNPEQSIFFPRYNFGGSISIGSLLNTGKRVDISQQNINIAEAEQDQEKLKLRGLVLSRYYEYLQALDIYKNRITAETDAKQILQFESAKFKEGTTQMDKYIRASQNYQLTSERLIEAKGDIKQAKIALEEVIGIPIENAILYHKQLVGNGD